MSPQLLMVLLQEAPLRPGHVPMAPQPIVTSESSSAVPHSRSSPPQRAPTFRMSRAWARPVKVKTWDAVAQSVAGGRVPATLASSHLWRAVVTRRVYFADSEESARLQLRGSAYAPRGLATASRVLAVTARATRTRRGRRLRFIWLSRSDA